MANCGYYCVMFALYEGADGSGELVGYSDPAITFFENAPHSLDVENTDDGSRMFLVLGGPYATIGEAASKCPGDNGQDTCDPDPDDSDSNSESESSSESSSYSYSYSYSYSGSGSYSGSASMSGSASGSGACGITISSIILDGGLSSGSFTLTNIGTVDVNVTDILQGSPGGAPYPIITTVPTLITPGNFAVFSVDMGFAFDLRGTSFTVVNDCADFADTWPLS